MNSIGLIGAGSQAKEMIDFANDLDLGVDFMAIQKQYINLLYNNIDAIDIEKPSERQLRTSVLSAIGAPALKKELLDIWPGGNYMSIIAPSAWVSRKAELGEGVLIAPGTQVSTNVEIGNHALINMGVTLSHDVAVGEYSTISPGANLGGNVKIGKGVFIGLGAVIKNDIEIADGSVIGAGAVVLDNVSDENSVVVGVPGKVIKRNKSWLREIK